MGEDDFYEDEENNEYLDDWYNDNDLPAYGYDGDCF